MHLKEPLEALSSLAWFSLLEASSANRCDSAFRIAAVISVMRAVYASSFDVPHLTAQTTGLSGFVAGCRRLPRPVSHSGVPSLH